MTDTPTHDPATCRNGDHYGQCSGVTLPAGFPFPLAEPRPDPVMISRPCGCTSMVVEEAGGQPVQVSWCVDHEDDAPWPPSPTTHHPTPEGEQ